MTITIELTEEEAQLIVRWFEEKMPLTSHYVGLRAESVITKIRMVQNARCPRCLRCGEK